MKQNDLSRIVAWGVIILAAVAAAIFIVIAILEVRDPAYEKRQIDKMKGYPLSLSRDHLRCRAAIADARRRPTLR